MLKRSSSRASGKVFIPIATVYDESTEHEKKAPIAKVYMRSSEIVDDGTENNEQRVWSEKKLGFSERMIM